MAIDAHIVWAREKRKERIMRKIPYRKTIVITALAFALFFALPYIFQGIGILIYYPASFKKEAANAFVDTVISKIKKNDTEWIISNSREEFSNPLPLFGYDSLRIRLLNSKLSHIDIDGFSRQPRNELTTIHYSLTFDKYTFIPIDSVKPEIEGIRAVQPSQKHWNKYKISFAYYKDRWWIYTGHYDAMEISENEY